MKKYILVYNIDTEEIISEGYVYEDDINLQAGEGEAVVASDSPLSRTTHYILGGELHEYTDEQIELRAERPSRFHRWSNVSMSWEDTRSLELIKSQKWDLIKLARQAAIDAPLVVPGIGTFDSDEKARINITNSAQLMQTLANSLQPGGAEPTITFTLYDNSEVELTAGQMVDVGLMLGQKVQQAFAIGRQLRANIESAQTVEQVASIQWPS